VKPLVVVSAGTYHLPFTRLIEWTETWAAANPEVRVVVQHGATRPAALAENHGILPHAELLSLFERADAIVLQGGAGGIMDCRSLGRRPIVVPRIPVDDEVVDDHQLRFAERGEEFGLLYRALTESALAAMLDDALAGRLPTRLTDEVAAPGVAAVADALRVPPRRLPERERFRRLAHSVRGLVADRLPRRSRPPAQ
jgi:UDP-N-acetylglucosamine transferase subunit ALG13